MKLRVRTQRKKHSKYKLSKIGIYVSKRINKQLKKAHSCGKIAFLLPAYRIRMECSIDNDPPTV